MHAHMKLSRNGLVCGVALVTATLNALYRYPLSRFVLYYRALWHDYICIPFSGNLHLKRIHIFRYTTSYHAKPG